MAGGLWWRRPDECKRRKEIVASSPRLRGASYLGSSWNEFPNRNAVAAIPFSSGARVMLATTPLGL